MKKALIIFTTLFTALSAATLLSCTTIKEIPEDKTSAQIIQMGQNAVSSGDYKSALLCYQTVIDRFGEDPAIYVEAKYELAHVYSKQKKYEPAYAIYTELLEMYDEYGIALPASYKKLCQIGLSKIPEGSVTTNSSAKE